MVPCYGSPRKQIWLPSLALRAGEERWRLDFGGVDITRLSPWKPTDCVKLPIRQMGRLGVCWVNNSVYSFLDKGDHCCYLITVWWRLDFNTRNREVVQPAFLAHVMPTRETCSLGISLHPFLSGKVLTSSQNVYFNIKWKDKGQKAQLYIRNEPAEEHIRGKWGRLQLIWESRYNHGYTL